jgi:hypothetical protein
MNERVGLTCTANWSGACRAGNYCRWNLARVFGTKCVWFIYGGHVVPPAPPPPTAPSLPLRRPSSSTSPPRHSWYLSQPTHYTRGSILLCNSLLVEIQLNQCSEIQYSMTSFFIKQMTIEPKYRVIRARKPVRSRLRAPGEVAVDRLWTVYRAVPNVLWRVEPRSYSPWPPIFTDRQTGDW